MIHYIYEGDIYIANMTQQLTIESKKHHRMYFTISVKITLLPLAAIWILIIIRLYVLHRSVF